MKRSRFASKSLLMAGCAALAVSAAMACGPYFPQVLTSYRSRTLARPPANSFEFEARNLLPRPSIILPVVEGPDPQRGRDEAEVMGLTEDQADQARRMRAAESAAEALSIGEGLPTAIKLYTAGAVAFSSDVDASISLFEQVLELPEAERDVRATWAAFSLGRIYAEKKFDDDKAISAFRLTQRLAVAGAPDPLGLALASIGEEAKLWLLKADPPPPDPEDEPNNAVETPYRQNFINSVRLYAYQAAMGSSNGVQSLRILAENLFAYPDEIARLIDNPIVLRLLTAYAINKSQGDAVWSLAEAEENARNKKLPAPERRKSDTSPIELLLQAVMKRGLSNLSGADGLAVLAYQQGKFEAAGKLAERSLGPRASWVKAKLALQRGDTKSAAAFYADAMAVLPPSAEPSGVSSENGKRLIAEAGVLSLARGEFAAALDLMYRAGGAYWGDIAYLADRVLTVNELKAFVDAKVGMPKSPAEDTIKPMDEDGASEQGRARDPSASLRHLLGRRLVRSGRYQDALPYFEGVHTYGDEPVELKDKVGQYTSALFFATDKSSNKIDQARSWYQAARLAREFGMEMMGTEGSPDQFIVEGDYKDTNSLPPSRGSLTKAVEISRYSISKAMPNRRFHYRYLAVAHAGKAADLLPPRSQAYAAVLCKAAEWMRSSYDVAAEKALYRRYVKNGAVVPFAPHFGRDCPEPDFERASKISRTGDRSSFFSRVWRATGL